MRLCPAMITRPITATVRGRNATSPASRIMHQPMTQMMPAIS